MMLRTNGMFHPLSTSLPLVMLARSATVNCVRIAKWSQFSIEQSVRLGTRMSSMPRAEGHQSRSRSHVTTPMPCNTVPANWDSSVASYFVDRFMTRFISRVMIFPHC